MRSETVSDSSKKLLFVFKLGRRIAYFMISNLPIATNYVAAVAATRSVIDAPAQQWRAAERALACQRALSEWELRRPVPEHTANAFQRVSAMVNSGRTLALDSGCGTGRSTRALASALPFAEVIGIDRSAVRLCKGQNALADRRALHEDVSPPNAHAVRADFEHFWRLATHSGWRPSYQFFFYPNPYPARGGIKRRLYGRPAFPYVVELGGRVEIRANWPAYLEEFRAAYCALAPDVLASEVHPLADASSTLPHPISNFEAKFLAAGTSLYRLVIDSRTGLARSKCPLAENDDMYLQLNRI